MAQDVVTMGERHAAFVKVFVETGDVGQASKIAAYTKANGYYLLNQPHIARAIANGLRRRVVDGAPAMLSVVETIALDERVPPRTRLDAAKTWLDRAGFIPPKASAEKGADAPLHEMTMGELRDLAARLDDEIAGRARPISATLAPAAPDEHDPTLDLLE